MILSEDRPLSRSIIKTGVRLLLGASRAHWQDSLPGLRIDASRSTGQIVYRGVAVGSLYPGAILGHSQKQTYLVGSGPSINDCDMRLVEPRTAILLNGAIQLMHSDISQPLAVAVEDERFVWRHFDMMRERIRPDTICLFSIQVLRALCEQDRGWLSDKRIILIDNLTKPYGRRRRRADELEALDFVVYDDAQKAALSLQPDKGVVQGGSVAVSAIQFLLACKPRSIGLFGIDIKNADEPRFYESAKSTAFSGIASAQDRILRYFDIAKRCCEEQATTLECYSAQSALLELGIPFSDRFSRASYRS